MKKVYSASITSLTEEGRIDVKSLDRLIKFDIERGIDGFFLLGTTGEADKPVFLYYLPQVNGVSLSKEHQ